MRKISLPLLAMAFVAFLFTSCSTEETGASGEESQKATLSFGATLNNLLNSRMQNKQQFSDLPECSDAAPSTVMVVLSVNGVDMAPVTLDILSDDLDDDGTTDYYTDYSEDLELEAGTYMLEQFIVYDASDNVIWIAPRDAEGSGLFEGYVTNPLPMTINLGAGVKKYVDVEVLCFDDREVNQYGYLFFDLIPRELKEFCVFANYCTDNGRHYTANYSLEVWYVRDGEGDIKLYPRGNESSPVTGVDDNGDYFAEPLCVVIPTPQFGEEADEDYLYYKLTLLDWPDNYGDIEDGALVEDGYLTWEDIEDLLDTDDNPDTEDSDIDYLHIFFNCNETPGGDCPAGPGDIDGDCVPDGEDMCPGYNDKIDSDGDGIPDGCDACPYVAVNDDADGDCVPNNDDICPGSDDHLDADEDGVPDGCDICAEGDDSLDTDNDDVPDACDTCPGGDDNVDENNNGIPDACDYVTPGNDCETAFMLGNNTFISLGLTNSRWGWTEHFTGADGSYTYPLYAGAGQNDYQNKGYQAGNIIITVTGTNVEVEFDLFTGITINETHIYFSDSSAPNTISPGQYGNTDEDPNATGETYNFTYSGDGNFWIIVHAGSCQ
ncbi:hypothetical protein [Zunongwangia sp. H14]|uniref:hypothetical protein n=1 Tax=Zunongwangia sp. H14 TaxID=3240792 RepID=UPI003563E858